MNITQTCTACNIEKPIDKFYFRHTLDSYNKRCKVCVKDSVKLYNTKNAIVVKERRRAYYEKNKDVIAVKGKKYRAANKTILKQRSAKYYKENRHSILEKKVVYHQQNKAQRSAYHKNSMEHPNFVKCWELSNLRPYSAKLNNIEGAR